MTARPEDFGFVATHALEACGRARRFQAGAHVLLFRLEPIDAAAAKLLLALQEAGVGGFFLGGTDAEGPWLLRGAEPTSLKEWLRAHRAPLDYVRAVKLVGGYARALHVCEQHGVFPGPYTSSTLGIDPTPGSGADALAIVRADSLLARLFGASTAADAQASEQALTERWIAPEQADGAAWDAAGNRYVLGCLLYRLLSGQHPFSGRGLRLGLELSRRGVAPFEPDIARTLPPGLQALCLSLLAPAPHERPNTTLKLAQELARFEAMPVTGASSASVPLPLRPALSASQPIGAQRAGDGTSASRARSSQAPAQKSLKPGSWILTVAIWCSAVLVLLIGGFVIKRSTAGSAAASQPGLASAALSKLTPADAGAARCASCHTRQAAEWQRSVMGYSAKSPLFQALEMVIEEQIGREASCPKGAGALREAGSGACMQGTSGHAMTGTGGALWCAYCHAPLTSLGGRPPAWDAHAVDNASRAPLASLLSEAQLEGITCAFCHQAVGPVTPGAERAGHYEGNPSWTSPTSGKTLLSRPEDKQGLFGIANSGFSLSSNELFPATPGRPLVPSHAHARTSDAARAYRSSSEFCGSCHDVRLFGTDTLGAERGEPFKRLRNAYSEWRVWAQQEREQGKVAPTCQDCHMSLFPGVCAPKEATLPLRSEDTALARACPPGMRFSPRAPSQYAAGADGKTREAVHYFTGVDVPLSATFPESYVDQSRVDVHGIPLGARQRRDLLLGAAFRFEVSAQRKGNVLEVPVTLENLRAGHRIPAGFSQEREVWVHLRVTDAADKLVYEVGRVDASDEDLHDKTFLRVNVDDRVTDASGRPLGVFGADVADGPDVPRWDPPPDLGGTAFRGRGLINLQNGFLRCVRCRGRIGPDGLCLPVAGERHRAQRYDDGDYDLETGKCGSNLEGRHALMEVYFPVGGLDASRGVSRGPDAIVDTRSAAPRTPQRYTYELPINGRQGPFQIEARLMFRAFPPFLIRAFAAYENLKAQRGERPQGALVSEGLLKRLEAVELQRQKTSAP